MIGTGERAPEVVLPALDGSGVRVPGDGVALVVFFKEECGACQVTMPRVPRFRDAFPGLRLWAVSQEDARTTVTYEREHAPGLPALVDAPGYEGSLAYGIESVPSFFLIDSDGVVRRTLVGWDRNAFNDLAVAAADLLGVGVDIVELVDAGEGPDFRPG